MRGLLSHDDRHKRCTSYTSGACTTRMNSATQSLLVLPSASSAKTRLRPLKCASGSARGAKAAWLSSTVCNRCGCVRRASHACMLLPCAQQERRRGLTPCTIHTLGACTESPALLDRHTPRLLYDCSWHMCVPSRLACRYVSMGVVDARRGLTTASKIHFWTDCKDTSRVHQGTQKDLVNHFAQALLCSMFNLTIG